jgi:hypothetical protein
MARVSLGGELLLFGVGLMIDRKRGCMEAGREVEEWSYRLDISPTCPA